MKQNDWELVWENIVQKTDICRHNFDEAPLYVSHKEIKNIVKDIKVSNNKREIRILGSIIQREKRPKFFIKNKLFLLPADNRNWVIVKGEGYFDTPPVEDYIKFENQVSFYIESFDIKNSRESLYLDKAFAYGILQDFIEDNSIYLTIRGKMGIPVKTGFNYYVNNLEVENRGSRIEIDGGYEGQDSLYLVEAKIGSYSNEIIRQLYFPYRLWNMTVDKPIRNIFFQYNPKNDLYSFWEVEFEEIQNYNSIKLLKTKSYKIV